MAAAKVIKTRGKASNTRRWLSGRIIFRYPDHDEVYTAGDAYYGAPGHLALLFAGTELVEFSPTGPLNESMAVISKNLEAGRA